jgi:tetratricopeptide (TPR) repeat protein
MKLLFVGLFDSSTLWRWAIMLWLIVACGLPLPALSVNPMQLFEKANEHYQQGNYQQSIRLYDSILKAGYISPELYFNLGNAHYKAGELPAAILNYERALKLRPADKDTEYNLKLANSQTIDRIEPLPEVFYKKWINRWLMETPAEKRFRMVIILLWITAGLTAGWLFIRQGWLKSLSFYLAIAVLALSVFFFMVATWQKKQISRQHHGIIFQPNVYVKASPDEKSANLFMLHGGTKVQLIDEIRGWHRIQLPNGMEGWLPVAAVEKI